MTAPTSSGPRRIAPRAERRRLIDARGMEDPPARPERVAGDRRAARRKVDDGRAPRPPRMIGEAEVDRPRRVLRRPAAHPGAAAAVERHPLVDGRTEPADRRL